MQRIDIDKIKAHVERNKRRYIIGGAVAGTIALALITCYIMRRGFTPRMYIRPKSKENVYTFKMQGASSYSQGRKNGLALQTVPGTSFAGPVSQTLGNASPIIFANGDVKSKITTNVYKNKKGHPGYLTGCIDTNDVFESQKKAASAFGISDKAMSEHLKGKLPDANGHHFERVIVQ